MGRYVSHVVNALRAAGESVTLLLFRGCRLRDGDALLDGLSLRFANYAPDALPADTAARRRQARDFSAFLTALIARDGFDVYVDATPFVPPCRLDVIGVASVALCYDFIPLRHPDFYLGDRAGREVYVNGLTRVAKADGVVCISRTVADQATRYLGLSPDRLSVVCPRLDPWYETESAPPAEAAGRSLFTILGAHRSKNPEGAAALLGALAADGGLEIRVNAPTGGQRDVLARLGLPPSTHLTHSITDKEKLALQSAATVVAHLSIEEGFGIPLLEAIFLNRRIIALDIPINRELFGPDLGADAALLLPVGARRIDRDRLESFLAAPVDPDAFAAARHAWRLHWRRAGEILAEAIDRAEAQARAWLDRLSFSIISSTPGENCGVADYSVAYARSAPGNVAFFHSEGDAAAVTHLPNVRIADVRDFSALRAQSPQTPCLFNFAFSEALFPGIQILRRHASPRDRVLVHERQYVEGLRHFLERDGLMDEFVLDAVRGDEPEVSRRALAAAGAEMFGGPPDGRPPPAAWLDRIPARFVSHLTPEVLDRMAALARQDPALLVNDMAEIERRLTFAPLGIDRRGTPAARRAGAAFRRRLGLQPGDVLVGHFGLIVPRIKLLEELALGVRAAMRRIEAGGAPSRRVFLLLVGKVIDAGVLGRIRAAFAGAEGRILRANPALEDDFDAAIAACDLVACLRRQRRGQLSHVFVRALSLARPVLVNRDSGYGYDEATTVADEDAPDGIAQVVERLLDPEAALRAATRAAEAYEARHRGDLSLQAILEEA